MRANRDHSPSLTILWLALPLIWLVKTVSIYSPAHILGKESDLLRGEAYTTGILLEFGVVETLPRGEGVRPAISLFRLILGILLGRLLFNYFISIDFLQETHSSVGARQRMCNG